MNAISKAMAESERSYQACKAATVARISNMLAQGPTGSPLGNQNSMATAKQQLAAFKSWVYSAIRPIANTIAGRPIVVTGSAKSKITKAKDGEPIENHPIVRLIADPNELMTGYGLVWATVASICLTGKAYWWLPDDAEQLHLIPVSWVLGWTGKTSFESWKVLPPGATEPFEIPADRMVYFAMPDPADPWGAISPLQACAGAVNNDHDILASQRSMFARGIHPSHAIIVAKDAGEGLGRPRLTDAQQRQVIAAIKKRYSGTYNHGEPLILDGLFEDVKSLSHSPAEMDWKDSAEAMKKRILETYGTSPYVLGGSEPGSRAASAVAMSHFYAGTVNPLIRLMSEAMTEWLAPIFGGGIRVRIEDAVADDVEMANRRAEILASNGAIFVNELRVMMGLPEDAPFDGQLVGGKNLQTTSPIEQGIRAMVTNALGGLEADSILESLNGRVAHAGSGRS